MTRKEYNGCTNYETWVVKLWMDNEEGSHNYWNEQADDELNRQTDSSGKLDEDTAIGNLADSLSCWHNELLPEVQGFAADLLGAAMSEVNWYEIAKSLVDDAKERIAA